MHQALQLLSPDSVYMQNEQEVGKIFLASYAVGDTIDVQQQNTLLIIANQCPATGGEAVYLARSIYQVYDPELRWDDDIICSGSQSIAIPESNTLRSSKQGVQIWPNPTNGSVNIALSDLDMYNVEIQVIDIWGRVHSREVIQDFSSVIEMNLLQLPTGTYFIKVLSEQQIIGTERLIISK